MKKEYIQPAILEASQNFREQMSGEVSIYDTIIPTGIKVDKRSIEAIRANIEFALHRYLESTEIKDEKDIDILCSKIEKLLQQNEGKFIAAFTGKGKNKKKKGEPTGRKVWNNFFASIKELRSETKDTILKSLEKKLETIEDIPKEIEQANAEKTEKSQETTPSEKSPNTPDTPETKHNAQYPEVEEAIKQIDERISEEPSQEKKQSLDVLRDLIISLNTGEGIDVLDIAVEELMDLITKGAKDSSANELKKAENRVKDLEKREQAQITRMHTLAKNTRILEEKVTEEKNNLLKEQSLREKAQEQILQLEEQTAKLESTLEKTRKSHAESIRLLSAQVAEKSSLEAELETKNNSLSKKIEELQEKLAVANTELSIAQQEQNTSIENTEITAEEIKENINKIKEKIDDLEKLSNEIIENLKKLEEGKIEFDTKKIYIDPSDKRMKNIIDKAEKKYLKEIEELHNNYNALATIINENTKTLNRMRHYLQAIQTIDKAPTTFIKEYNTDTLDAVYDQYNQILDDLPNNATEFINNLIEEEEINNPSSLPFELPFSLEYSKENIIATQDFENLFSDENKNELIQDILDITTNSVLDKKNTATFSKFSKEFIKDIENEIALPYIRDTLTFFNLLRKNGETVPVSGLSIREIIKDGIDELGEELGITEDQINTIQKTLIKLSHFSKEDMPENPFEDIIKRDDNNYFNLGKKGKNLADIWLRQAIQKKTITEDQFEVITELAEKL